MSASDELRQAIEAATAAVNRAIAVAKDLGMTEERDILIGARDVWVRAADRACNGAAPRGRMAVPPIVPASYSLKPPVRVRPPVSYPPLRLVEVEPFSATIDRVVRDAEHAQRASRKLLRDCEQERGAPDAG